MQGIAEGDSHHAWAHVDIRVDGFSRAIHAIEIEGSTRIRAQQPAGTGRAGVLLVKTSAGQVRGTDQQDQCWVGLPSKGLAGGADARISAKWVHLPSTVSAHELLLSYRQERLIWRVIPG